MTNRGIVNISKPVGGVAVGIALAALLAACSSGGGSGPIAHETGVDAGPSTSATPSTVAATEPVASAKIAPGDAAVTAKAAPAGRTETSFAGSGRTSTSSVPAHSPSAVPPLTGPVTYQSVDVSPRFNCAEAGTTYYTPPNITIGFDVTVLVTSPSLARDLEIAAPNPAPRGLSNASRLISSSALGNGVWRATYRTFASLYQPRYVPVTVDSLQASLGGNHYTIAFPSPVTITEDECNS